MKSTNLWTVIVVALVCINSITLIVMWKQTRPFPPTDSKTNVRDFLVTQLSLSKSQIEKFEVMRQAHHNKVENLNQKIHQLKDSLFGTLNNSSTGSKIVDTLTDKIGYNYALIDKTTFYHFKELRDILEPAQQKKLDEVIQQVLQMMSHPIPPHRPGPGPLRPEGPNPGGQGPDGLPEGPPPGNGPPPNNLQ